MRAVLLTFVLLLAPALVAAPSGQAHDIACDVDDLTCTRECLAHEAAAPGHRCYLYDSALA